MTGGARAQVLGRMKQLMVDNNTAASHSFLLDDDSSIPFSLDDIQNLMDEKVSYLCPEALMGRVVCCPEEVITGCPGRFCTLMHPGTCHLRHSSHCLKGGHGCPTASAIDQTSINMPRDACAATGDV